MPPPVHSVPPMKTRPMKEALLPPESPHGEALQTVRLLPGLPRETDSLLPEDPPPETGSPLPEDLPPETGSPLPEDLPPGTGSPLPKGLPPGIFADRQRSAKEEESFLWELRPLLLS